MIMKNRTESSHTAEELIENLRSLIAEAEATLSGDVVEKSNETLAELRSRLESGLNRLNGYYSQAKQRVVAGAKVTDDTIRTHPYESAAIALAVGVLLGALIRRR